MKKKIGLDQIGSINFVDDKINSAKMTSFVFDRLENILGKGENSVYHYFPLFISCFQKASFSRS